jgi:hypothetical protein
MSHRRTKYLKSSGAVLKYFLIQFQFLSYICMIFNEIAFKLLKTTEIRKYFHNK